MAEGTRLKTLDDIVKNLQEKVSIHSTKLDKIEEIVSIHSTKIDQIQETITNHSTILSDLVTKIASLESKHDSKLDRLLKEKHTVTGPSDSPQINPPPIVPVVAIPPPPPPRFSNLPPMAVQARQMRLDFPRFEGIDPSGWIFKAERFFDYHRISSDQRLLICSFHMDGKALPWFQYMTQNRQISTWEQFSRALESRFGPPEFEDPQGSLAKLMQHGSVDEYQTQFEALANRTIGLSSTFLVSCFIAGLKSDIKAEVLAFRPMSLSHAMGLARLQESKLMELMKINSAWSGSPGPPTNSVLSSSETSIPSPQVKHTDRYNIRRLSPIEMQVRREKGLCYNCDERYVVGHRCKSKPQLFLLDSGSDNNCSTSAAERLPDMSSSSVYTKVYQV